MPDTSKYHTTLVQRKPSQPTEEQLDAIYLEGWLEGKKKALETIGTAISNALKTLNLPKEGP